MSVPRGSGRFGSLSTNLVLTTLVAVVFVVTVISVTSLIGVYDLAQEQVSERHRTYVTVIGSEVEVRLGDASGVVSGAAEDLRASGSLEVDVVALRAAFEAGIRRVDGLMAVRDGQSVAAFGTMVVPTFVNDREIVARARAYDSTLFHIVHGDDGELEIWAIHPAQGDMLVLGRVRYDLMEETISTASSDEFDRAALMFDSNGEVLVRGHEGPELQLDSMEFDENGPTGGLARVDTMQGLPMTGRYVNISSQRGIEWTIFVGEPSSTMLDSTLGALAPTSIALVLAGMISVVVSVFVSGRLVRPLLDLEERANEGAAGAYVRPIQTDRRDEIGRLAEAFNMIALRLNALHDLSQLLASSSRLDQVLDGILAAMSHIMDTGIVAIYLFDAARESLVPVRARGLLEQAAHAVKVPEGGWLVNAAHGRECTFFTGTAPDISEFVGIDSPAAAACLAAPLVVGEESLGIVLVVRTDGRPHTQAEVEMVRTFSAQAAVAVHISRLFAEESASRRDAELMREVVERLASPGDLGKELESVSQLTSELVGVSSCVLALLDPSHFGLPEAVRPEQRALASLWREHAESSGVSSFTLFQDPRSDSLLEWAGAERVEFVPVVRSGAPAGVLALFLDSSNAPLETRARKLAHAVAQQVSLALENAFHFEQARMRAADLETVFRISQAVSSSLQVKVVLNRVLDVVQKIFSAEAVALMTYDEGSRRISTAMARGGVSASLLHYDRSAGDDVIGMVFESREPVRIDDLDALDDPITRDASGRGLGSLLVVPLLARGKSLGALSVFSNEKNAFTDEDMELLRTFGAQASLAIDTARVYGREHRVATVLKSSIVPDELPEYDEVECASLYLPSGGESEIGGDYYDVFRAPDGRIVAAMADVCGKGVSAATKTSMIKYTLRALVAAGYGPARCLAEVNRMVEFEGDASNIVTVWIGFLDVAAEELVYADGGHPPGLIYRPETRDIERLLVTGALLGASKDAVYEDARVLLSKGDMILLYTDGVTEAREGNKFFGEGRVRRALRYGGSAVEVSQRLRVALDRFVHGDLRDDAAVLVIRVRDVQEE